MWVVDSTPVECGRSRDTARRSDLAGWAEYGYCASHSRYFWGLRLHLVATLGGLPIAFALTGAKADERQTLLGILTAGILALTAAIWHNDQTGQPVMRSLTGRSRQAVGCSRCRAHRPMPRTSSVTGSPGTGSRSSRLSPAC